MKFLRRVSDAVQHLVATFKEHVRLRPAAREWALVARIVELEAERDELDERWREEHERAETYQTKYLKECIHTKGLRAGRDGLDEPEVFLPSGEKLTYSQWFKRKAK